MDYSCIVFPDKEAALTRRLLENLAALDVPPSEIIEIPRPGIFPERKAFMWALPRIGCPYTAVLDSDMLLDPNSTARMLPRFSDHAVGCVAGVLRDECVRTFGYFKIWRTPVLDAITRSTRPIREITPDTDYAGQCENLGWKFLRLSDEVGAHAPVLDPFNIFNIYFRVGVKQRARGRIGTSAQLWGVEGALNAGSSWAHLALFAFHCGIREKYEGDPHDDAWHEFSFRHYLAVQAFCEELVRSPTRFRCGTIASRRVTVMLVSCCLMTGGVERTMINMARHLDPDRFNVVIAYEWGADKEMLMDLDAAGRRHLEVAGEWDSVLQAEKPDVIVSFLRTPVYEAAQRLGIPMIERTPGWNGHSNVTKDRFERVVVEYELFKRELLSKPELMAKEERVEVLYNGVDLERFVPMGKREARSLCGLRTDALLIGTVARVHPVKNLGMQIRALKRLVEGGIDAELHVIGRESDREERSRLDSLARDHGIESRVFFHGVLRNPAPYLAAFDVVALTSLTEGAPNALIEAMAMKRPIVATDVGGVREVTDGLGLYVAVDDDESFAQAVVAMSTREFVEYPNVGRHSMARYVARWERILEEVFRSRGAMSVQRTPS